MHINKHCTMTMRALHGVKCRLIFCILVIATVFTPAAVYAGSYEDFFKALQLDLAPTVTSLLSRGFDANATDPIRGDPALLYAVRYRSFKALAVLAKNAEVKIDAPARNGDTALMVAAYIDAPEAVAMLLANGAQPNRPGWTALHYAAASGNVDIVRSLLEKFAYIDAESPSKTTPLMMAARNGKTSVMELLIQEGADQTLRDIQGMSAADFSAKFSDVRSNAFANPLLVPAVTPNAVPKIIPAIAPSIAPTSTPGVAP